MIFSSQREGSKEAYATVGRVVNYRDDGIPKVPKRVVQSVAALLLTESPARLLVSELSGLQQRVAG